MLSLHFNSCSICLYITQTFFEVVCSYLLFQHLQRDLTQRKELGYFQISNPRGKIERDARKRGQSVDRVSCSVGSEAAELIVPRCSCLKVLLPESPCLQKHDTGERQQNQQRDDNAHLYHMVTLSEPRGHGYTNTHFNRF